MINKTKDYNLFKFRDDNREKIDKAHVARLIDSIQARNLLEFRPIVVNEKMEVVDGQHRLLAAKALGLEIYYQKQDNLQASDIIAMNINKSWTMADYHNFYCKHDFPEYKKLADFMQRNNLALTVALNIASGKSRLAYKDFRKGNFKFVQEVLGTELDICWETIDYIKKMNGFSIYTASSRFWKALLKLVRHPQFDETRWRNNMHKLISNFSPKASTEEYERMLQTVFNWHNHSKITLLEDIQ